jgi:hypothetical protein
LLLGQDPTLRPEQVAWLLERGADDANPSTGCAECPVGRDKYTGWGALDVAHSLSMLADGTPLPPPDRYEPNDDAGPWAHALPPLPRTIQATLDYWDDDVDVYRIRLSKGQRLFARLTAKPVGAARLALWAPGTERVETLASASLRVARSRLVGSQTRLGYRAPASGTYYLEAKLTAKTREPLAYRLSVARSS